MNQWIRIRYKPDWHPNYWQICICLNGKQHRDKAPSWLNSNSYWNWDVHDKCQKHGYNFDWDEK